MERIFESLICAVPIIKEIFKEDTAIVIEDNEKIIFVSEGINIKPPSKVGDKLNQQDDFVRNRVRKTKKAVHTLLNKEEHGVDLKLVNIPLFDEANNMIGVFCIIRDTQKEGIVKSASKELMHSLEETSSSIDEIADSAVKFSEKINIIIEKTDGAKEGVKNSGEAVNLIQDISKRINMLGLNAAIESARAGEFGKGFSVVASEMRKLATISGESSKKVSETLMDMKNSINLITDEIHELSGISTNQASSVEEVSAAIDEIANNSQILVEKQTSDI